MNLTELKRLSAESVDGGAEWDECARYLMKHRAEIISMFDQWVAGDAAIRLGVEAAHELGRASAKHAPMNSLH